MALTESYDFFLFIRRALAEPYDVRALGNKKSFVYSWESPIGSRFFMYIHGVLSVAVCVFTGISGFLCLFIGLSQSPIRIFLSIDRAL